MSGDYSRISFDPRDDDLGVLLQQGRPLSDAEWNALVAQLRRRLHAGMFDTVGPAVVPRTTQDGFKLSLSGGHLAIAPGRIYVDGILAENHGAAPDQFDARLEENTGTKPLYYRAPAPDPTAVQPWLPDAPALPTSGRHLVYLDVWTREVSHFMRPELLEVAVGVDSTTRLQTVWQVKVLANVGSGVDCSTPLDSIPGWLQANRPAAGRLSTRTAVVAGQPDPCLIPPGGGYKGLENQLYRVEVHQGGTLGKATFKWSRDNASVETRVTHIKALNQLSVESTGKDAVLRFSPGDWIEITDDWLELNNLPGELRRIKAGNGVDDATRTILLEKPLPVGRFPADAQGRVMPGRHTRVRRWDQRGKVVDHNGTQLQDLDTAASTGEIGIPGNAATGVLLEHGVVVNFSTIPGNGEFRSGDWWVFAARSTDASLEELQQAPPRGIHHHYAKLGILNADGVGSDCRIHWPPPPPVQGGEGDHCACTICVTPAQHANNAPSLQDAIDQIIRAGGGTLCLEVGDYALREPLSVRQARSLRITGKGAATRVHGDRGVFALIEGAEDLTLSHFTAEHRGSDAAEVMHLHNGTRILVEDLSLESKSGAGVVLKGAFEEITFRRNRFRCFYGIWNGPSGNAAGLPTGLTDLRIQDNDFHCAARGISLDDITVHQLLTRISGNSLTLCGDTGVYMSGSMTPGGGVEISGNNLEVVGNGLELGLQRMSIVDNTLSAERGELQRGIGLIDNAKRVIDTCLISGNRFFRHTIGVAVGVDVRSLQIRANHFTQHETAISASGKLRLSEVSVEANQFERVGQVLRLQCTRLEESPVRVIVNANQWTATAPTPAVLVNVPDDCLLSANQSLHLGSSEGKPTLQIKGRSLVFSNNRVEAAKRAQVLLIPQLENDTWRCTVLGNICSGPIDVGNLGGGLFDPWKPLNLVEI